MSRSDGGAMTPREQDLSLADRQLLLAFVEKRKWYEGKLEYLKSLAPVYPFVHPVIVTDSASSGSYTRAGSETSPWRLPDKRQLAAWVAERNALEEEIELFDDGDLARMKERTREMTRLPLTQPSTDLVEVTFDLILLIDQLLTVLRRRGALLSLTSLRLQWDDLRYEAKRDIEGVKGEVDHVVSEAETWLPGAAPPERERHHSLRSNCSSQIPPSSSSNSLSDSLELPLENNMASGTPASPARIPRSSSKASSLNSSPSKHTGPRSALHSSILRSQLVGLHTRDRNIAFNVKRSSAILDRMIDSASRLEDLGGVEGPTPQEGRARHGAIPDLLIDLQEDLEAEAKGISATVNWCSQFESQNREGVNHFTASTRAQQLAQEAVSELQAAFSQPACSSKHAVLADLFQIADAALPPSVDHGFPQPSHPDYPSKDEHNEVVISTLREARDAAQADVDRAGKLLTFYKSLLNARKTLQSQHKRMQQLREDIVSAMDHLERGTSSAHRPSLAAATSGADHSEWLSSVPEWLKQGELAQRAAVDAHESTVLAVMQYRKALSSAPMALKPYLPPGGIPDDLGSVVDDDAADLIRLVKRCSALLQETRSDADALPLVLQIRQDNEEVFAETKALRAELVYAVNQAAWSTRMAPQLPDNLDGELAKLVSRTEDTKDNVDLLKTITNSPEVVTVVSDTSREINVDLAAARTELDLLSRVSKQAQVVRDVQVEAENLVASLVVADGVILKQDPAAIEQMKAKVEEWTDTLSWRVPFISGKIVVTSPESSSRTGERSSSAPLTPPLTPVGMESSSSVLPDLERLDSRVRNEVNHQSARVSAALANHITAMERAAFDSWAQTIDGAVRPLEAAVQSLKQDVEEYTLRAERVTHDRDDSQQASASALQEEGSAHLASGASLVTSLSLELDKVIGNADFTSADSQLRADFIASTCQVRQAASDAVKRAEQWRIDAETLVTRTEVHNTKSESTAPPPTAIDGSSSGKAATISAEDMSTAVNGLSGRDATEATTASLKTKSTTKLPGRPDATIGSLGDRLAGCRLDSAAHKPHDALRGPRKRASDLGVNGVPVMHRPPGATVSSKAGSSAGRVAGEAAIVSKMEENITLAHGSGARVAQKCKRNSGSRTETDNNDTSRAVDSAPSPAAMVAVRTVSATPEGQRDLQRTPSSSSVHSSRESSQSAQSYKQGKIPTTPRSASDSMRRRSTFTRSPLDPAVTSPQTPRTPSTHKRPPVALPHQFRTPPSTSSGAIPLPTSSRRPHSSLASSSVAQPPTFKRPYEPHPKSRLDTAVARVLNGLEVDVQMFPAGRESPDEWTDKSGRYWIGTGSRARLCFCRILRSRTVMVRVGGGWVELSRYILDRFNEADDAPPLEVGDSPASNRRGELKTGAGLTLSASQSSLRSTVPATPRTPARRSLPALRSSLLDTSPTHDVNRLSRSPSFGPSSPHVVQFMRKASESPSVRDIEREIIRAQPDC